MEIHKFLWEFDEIQEEIFQSPCYKHVSGVREVKTSNWLTGVAIKSQHSQELFPSGKWYPVLLQCHSPFALSSFKHRLREKPIKTEGTGTETCCISTHAHLNPRSHLWPCYPWGHCLQTLDGFHFRLSISLSHNQLSPEAEASFLMIPLIRLKSAELGHSLHRDGSPRSSFAQWANCRVSNLCRAPWGRHLLRNTGWETGRAACNPYVNTFQYIYLQKSKLVWR